MITLDTFQKPETDNKELTVEHAFHLYELSHEKEVEEIYNNQIQAYLAEEQQAKKRHEEYINQNYVRIGGN